MRILSSNLVAPTLVFIGLSPPPQERGSRSNSQLLRGTVSLHGPLLSGARRLGDLIFPVAASDRLPSGPSPSSPPLLTATREGEVLNVHHTMSFLFYYDLNYGNCTRTNTSICRRDRWAWCAPMVQSGPRPYGCSGVLHTALPPTRYLSFCPPHSSVPKFEQAMVGHLYPYCAWPHILPLQSPLFLSELHNLSIDEETFAFSNAVHVCLGDVFSVGFLA